MKYPIWSRFSEEARRAAATAEYSDRWTGKAMRTMRLECPLGVALNAAGFQQNGCRFGAPASDELPYVRGFAYPGVKAEAHEFINAWDAGRIDPADLPSLLGLS